MTATALPAGAVGAAASQPTVGFTLNTKAATSPVAVGGVALGLGTSSVLQITNTGPSGSILVLPSVPTVDSVPVFPITTTPTGGLGALAISVGAGSVPGCSGASLLSGQSCDIGLVLQARQAGPLTATVDFGGNGTATAFTVSLTGVEGYFVATSGGGEAAFDTAGSGPGAQPSFVDPDNRALNAPVVATASTQTALGYYQAAADGGVFTRGDAIFFGSQGGHPLNRPVLGMAVHDAKVFTSGGGVDGYWLVAADGGVFSFGDAVFHGSKGGQHLNQPILGIAATPDGGGYWLVGADGGVFSFGDAVFHGSEGGAPLAQPTIGIAPTNNGGGYWLEAANAATFNLGDAPNVSQGFVATTHDIVGISPYGDPVLPLPTAAATSGGQTATLTPSAWHGPGVHARP